MNDRPVTFLESSLLLIVPSVFAFAFAFAFMLFEFVSFGIAISNSKTCLDHLRVTMTGIGVEPWPPLTVVSMAVLSIVIVVVAS